MDIPYRSDHITLLFCKWQTARLWGDGRGDLCMGSGEGAEEYAYQGELIMAKGVDVGDGNEWSLTGQNAHPGGVSGVSFSGNDRIISSGQDGCVRTWTVPEI
jgi:hypothetical protein